MVRINLIDPKQLSDQHLIAEYREILLLFGTYKNKLNKKMEPSDDNLMNPFRFFYNKLLYLKRRHTALREEMIVRGFKPTKFVDLNDYPWHRINDFEPEKIHKDRIIKRITQRVNEKPNWYRYYGEYKTPEFFEEMMK